MADTEISNVLPYFVKMSTLICGVICGEEEQNEPKQA